MGSREEREVEKVTGWERVCGGGVSSLATALVGEHFPPALPPQPVPSDTINISYALYPVSLNLCFYSGGPILRAYVSPTKL